MVVNNYIVDSLIVPTWVAEQITRGKRIIAKTVHEERLKTDPEYRAEWEAKLKNTKPMMYVDTSTDGRPVIIVGGRGMWYEDMKEKAKRLLEKPRPSADPEFGFEKRDIKADTAMAVDRKLRADKGVKVFHIANNPCYKTEE